MAGSVLFAAVAGSWRTISADACKFFIAVALFAAEKSIFVIAFCEQSTVYRIFGFTVNTAMQFDLFSYSGFVLAYGIGDGFLGRTVEDAFFDYASFRIQHCPSG